jgi:hypothetical protein
MVTFAPAHKVREIYILPGSCEGRDQERERYPDVDRGDGTVALTARNVG